MNNRRDLFDDEDEDENENEDEDEDDDEEAYVEDDEFEKGIVELQEAEENEGTED